MNIKKLIEKVQNGEFLYLNKHISGDSNVWNQEETNEEEVIEALSRATDVYETESCFEIIEEECGCITSFQIW